MRSSFRMFVGVLALAALATATGCKTGKAGTVPTASPMARFEAPDEDDVFPDADDETEAEDAGDAGDQE